MRISDWSSDVCSSDLAEAARVDDAFGQGRHVAQTEVQALAGNGMNAVRRIADQGQAAVDGALRVQQRQGIAPAPAAPQREPAQRIAEAALQLLRKVLLVERQHRSEEHTSEIQSLMRIP